MDSLRNKQGMKPDAKIVILGGSGFVGQSLRDFLGPKSVTLLHSRTRGPGGYDVASGWMDVETLRGADAIINLAGSPIAVRWTAKAREEIHTSRVGTTNLLIDTLNRAGIIPRVIVSMSGINRYAAHAEAELDETAPLDDSTFLGGVCRDWEAPLARLNPATRTVILRTGVVIGSGGALAKMKPIFNLGLGGRIGSGRQWMSWISPVDLCRLVHRCLSDNGPAGVVNAVHPHPVRNLEFTATLGQVMRRPTILPAPAWALRAILGQMAEETLLSSRRVVPASALKAGFRFDGKTDALGFAMDVGLTGMTPQWRELRRRRLDGTL